MKTRKLVFLAVMAAVAVALSIVESVISTFIFIIPGVKLGLANIITLVIMYYYSDRVAFLVVVIRIFLAGLLYTGLFEPAFWMSLAGGLLAFLAMFILKRVKIFSIMSVSVFGALMHMVGQILAAIVVLDTETLLYYLPYMMVIAVPTGIFTALVAKKLLVILKKQASTTTK